MLSSVLVLAFLGALHPMRFALTLLVVSQPRPVQNLLAFSAGCVTGFVPFVIIPFVLLHATPMSEVLPHDREPTTTAGYLQLGVGAVAILVAVLVSARAMNRRRQRAQVGPGGPASVPDSRTPAAITRLMSRAQDPPPADASVFGRALHRLYKAWKNGSLWVAYLLGLAFGGPQPDGALFVVAIIVGSEATIGAQVFAVGAFVAGMLLLQEIVLVSYLVGMARTQVMLGRLHDWSSAHRWQIVAAIFTVFGGMMMVRGIGSLNTATK